MTQDPQIEALIKDVAAKHGVGLSPDDPILVMYTIHEKLLDRAKVRQQEMLSDFESRMESAADRWGLESQDKANRSLTAALTASKSLMQDSKNLGMDSLTAAMQHQIARIERQINAHAKHVRLVLMVHIGLVIAVAALVVATTFSR